MLAESKNLDVTRNTINYECEVDRTGFIGFAFDVS